MDRDFEHGAPFYFATRNPPTASALDEDIYLTVTTQRRPIPMSRPQSTSFCRSNTQSTRSLN